MEAQQITLNLNLNAVRRRLSGIFTCNLPGLMTWKTTDNRVHCSFAGRDHAFAICVLNLVRAGVYSAPVERCMRISEDLISGGLLLVVGRVGERNKIRRSDVWDSHVAVRQSCHGCCIMRITDIHTCPHTHHHTNKTPRQTQHNIELDVPSFLPLLLPVPIHLPESCASFLSLGRSDLHCNRRSSS